MGREDFDLMGFVEYASFDYYLTIINFSSNGALYFSVHDNPARFGRINML